MLFKMKLIQIYILSLATNFLCISLFAQEDSISLDAGTVSTERTINTDSLKTLQKPVGKLFVGVDVFTPIMSIFSDKQGGQGLISYHIAKKWNVVGEFGYEKNHYDELDWDIDVKGMYLKLGFNWFISQDYKDASNGFYTGVRFAYASYQQTVNQYPIRLASNQIDEYGSLPKANVSAYWIEILGGARIQLVGNLYADLSIRPEIYVGSKKQQDIDPLVIPGYGKDIGSINFSVFWGLTYKIF